MFRTYTLPFIRGTAPTRLPGARLTTYQVNIHKNYDVGPWKDEGQGIGPELLDAGRAARPEVGGVCAGRGDAVVERRADEQLLGLGAGGEVGLTVGRSELALHTRREAERALQRRGGGEREVEHL